MFRPVASLRSRLCLSVAGVTLLSAAVGHGIAGPNGVMRLVELGARLEHIEGANARASETVASLRARARERREGGVSAERLAREKGLVRPDEVLFELSPR